MKYLIMLLLCIICLLPRDSHAQSTDLSITAIPLNPIPGQEVRLTAVSYGVNLNQTIVTWRYNNVVIASGTGITQASVTTPLAGQVGTVTATISGAGIIPATATLVLRGANVDLLWEATDSYTPPFYKGKALPSTNATIRAVAIPTISAPKNLAYMWLQNDEGRPTSSGVGKSWFDFKNNELDPQERISVSVEGTLFSGNGTATIVPKTPSLIAYQKNEGFIEYDHAVTQTINSSESGVIVRFEPYFFSVPQSINNDLSFTMKAGETDVSGGQMINEIRLSRPEGTSTIPFRVLVNTITYSLQNIDRLFTINFN